MASAPDRRVVLVGVGIPLAALVLILAFSLVGGTAEDGAAPAPTTPVVPEPAVDEGWNAELADALDPLRRALPTYASQVDEWASGALPADELARVLDEVEPVFATVDASIDALRAHPTDPLARPLVADATALYRQAVVVHRSALSASDADIARQYDRIGRRLRILGDRIFDRARERTAVAVDPGDDVRLVLPAEVPDWSRLELGVGPPLEPGETDLAEARPLERLERRATQPEREWLTAIDRLDVPEASDVRGALGDPARLAALARRLVGAAEAARDVAVPDADRGRADRVALGWLVLAEAARLAQLDALAGTDDAPVERLLELGSGPELAPG